MGHWGHLLARTEALKDLAAPRALAGGPREHTGRKRAWRREAT